MLHYNNNFPIYNVNDPFANTEYNHSAKYQHSPTLYQFTLQITDSSILHSSIPSGSESRITTPFIYYTIYPSSTIKDPQEKKEKEKEGKELKSREIIPRSKLGVTPIYPEFFSIKSSLTGKGGV